MKKFVLMMCFILTFTIVGNAQAFSKAECISDLTSKDIIPQYRLSIAKATARCNAVEKRINLLSKQILGKWLARIEGRTSTLQFFADGTALQDGNKKNWTIVSAQNQVGSESLQFDEFGPVSPIKIFGNTMSITWYSDHNLEHLARWKRIK